jgi:hypothetical protein
MKRSHTWIVVIVACALIATGVSLVRTRPVSKKASPHEIGPSPDVRIDLAPHGLPAGFFGPEAEKCADKIIGYRFVVWLNSETVAVGFNTSPYCRLSPDRKVEGSARVLVYNFAGTLKATGDLSYPADGDGELVADGEATSGPQGTLLFRLQSVNLDPDGRRESPAAILLLDENVKEVARIEQFLEQTTFAGHALVFQQGYTLTGPRTYVVMNGNPPSETERWVQDWPVGTLDRKFGEHAIAYMLCEQELRPNQYSSSNIIHANAKKRCTMNQVAKGQPAWTASLKEGETAAIVGILADGTVAGQINARESQAGQLVIWRHDGTTEILPWLSADYSGSIRGATADLSRYAAFATNDSEPCMPYENGCSEDGRWIVFDRSSKVPLVDRAFPKNGRAALSPDGLHYASFESGQLRIYSLPH